MSVFQFSHFPLEFSIRMAQMIQLQYMGKSEKREQYSAGQPSAQVGNHFQQQPLTDSVKCEEKRKIIKKKWMLNTHGDDQELKNWKPTKIRGQITNQNLKTDKKQINLAAQFLAILPKPKSQQNINKQVYKFESMPQSINYKKKQSIKPLFIPTQNECLEKISQNRKEYSIEKKLEDKGDEEKEKEIVKLLDEDEKVIPIRQIDLSKQIDDNWKMNSEIIDGIDELWEDSQLEGRGSLTRMVKEARKMGFGGVTGNKLNAKLKYGW